MLFQLPDSAFAQSVHFKLVPRPAVEARLKKYEGDNPKREATLKAIFTDAGCDAQNLSEQQVKGSRLPNVVCILPGTSGKIIIVGAHFDRTSAGDGVVDNWSGVSLLPSLYEAVKAQPRKHTYIFIGFTDEERGLVGSHFYAHQMTKEQIAATDAMVNMDTLGLAPTEVWASHSDKNLVSRLVYVGRLLNFPITGTNVERVGSTDSEEFSQRKIPSITIHSLTQKAFDDHILHSAKDQFSAMRLDDYYQTYHLMAAYIAYLDQL